MVQDVRFNEKLRPIINNFQDLMAATLGWQYIINRRLIDPIKLNDYVTREPDDSMGFHTSFEGDKAIISFSFGKHIQPFISSDFKPNKYLCVVHQILLGHCWEIMIADYEAVFGKDSLINRDLPIIQFCRHIRNGSFHGNCFDLRDGHPKLISEWRTKKITQQDNGKKIFADGEDEKFFLNWGDVLALIYEVSEIVYKEINLHMSIARTVKDLSEIVVKRITANSFDAEIND